MGHLSFWEFAATAERRRVIIGSLLAAVLMPVFGLVDYFNEPSQAHTLWRIRGVVLVVAVACAARAYVAKRWRDVAITSFILFVATASGLAAMIPLTGGSRSAYDVGLCQVFLGGGVLLMWSGPVAVLAYAVPLLLYTVPILLEPHASAAAIVVHLRLVLGIAAISLVSIQVRLRLSREAFKANEALARSNEALQALHRAKDHFFQNISHEFRTPLALILVPTERLLENASRSAIEQRELHETIRSSALRLLNLINDLLALAKLSSVEGSAEQRSTNLGALLEAVGREAGQLAQRSGVVFSVELDSGLPSYLTHAGHLEKVILNLLSNAFKFTPAGGRVVLSARDLDDGLHIAVSDTGPGIPPEDLPKLFQRFQQLDASRVRHVGGTGIGLALVRELMTHLGGDVQVNSVIGQGTTFTLHLPARLRTHGAPEATPAVDSGLVAALSRAASFSVLSIGTREPVPQVAGSHGPRVLVVEDDPGLRRQLLEILAAGHRVVAVSNGVEALEAARHRPPHLVVSDVMMPRMDGFELTAAIRDEPSLRDVPIVLLTSKAELEDRVAGRKRGADSYLAKPFHPDELLATIEGLLKARQRLLGRYVLLRRIASGGQSEIFEGEDVLSGERAAVKLLHHATQDGAARERLRREAEALRALSHPNVVRFLAHGFEENRAWLATELVLGDSLREVLVSRGPFSPPQIVAVGVALADALAAVHAAGLIHRDLKCDNVMLVSPPGKLGQRVRLLDFGISVQEHQERVTGPGQLVGTPGYMAPELLSGGPPSTASDLYALGRVLQALAMGRLPSASGRSALPAAIPDALADIIGCAMHAKPERRPLTAAALRDRLAALDNPLSEGLALEGGERTVTLSQGLVACPELPTPEHVAGCRRCQETARAVTEDGPLR